MARRNYFPAKAIPVKDRPPKPTTKPQPEHSDIHRFFNRTPSLAVRSMREDVQGTMDLSLNWPLAPLPKTFDYVAIAGTNNVTIAAPDTGTHMMVTFGMFTTSMPELGQASVLFLQEKNTPLMPVQLQIVQLTPGRTQVPLVNGNTLGNDGIVLSGIRQVYVPAGYFLIHSYTAAIGGETVGLNTLNFIFPETQPLSTLL
jgi:hypothetical protein